MINNNNNNNTLFAIVSFGSTLAPLQASIGDHIPATQREERVSEREKEEIIAVSVEVRGKRSLDPNKKRVHCKSLVLTFHLNVPNIEPYVH